MVSTNYLFVSYYFDGQLVDPEIYNIREYEAKKTNVTCSLALKFQRYGSSDLSVVSIHPSSRKLLFITGCNYYKIIRPIKVELSSPDAVVVSTKPSGTKGLGIKDSVERVEEQEDSGFCCEVMSPSNVRIPVKSH